MHSGFEILRPLDEGGEIRIRHRETHRPDDLAAAFLEGALEGRFGIVAGTVVGHHSVALLDAALGRPPSERVHDLRQGDRRADHVGRLGDNDRRGRVHHHHEFFRLLRDGGGSDRIRRQHPAGQDVHLVANDEFLRQPLGKVGRNAANVLADDLDLLAGNGVAVLLHVGLDAVLDLDAGVGELSGERQHEADLDGALRIRGGMRAGGNRNCAQAYQQFSHRNPPKACSANDGNRCNSPGQFYRRPWSTGASHDATKAQTRSSACRAQAPNLPNACDRGPRPAPTILHEI